MAVATRVVKKVLSREACRAAAILLLILNIVFFPCIWGKKNMLESAQLSSSVVPAGAWAGKQDLIAWAKTLDGAAAAWFFEPSLAVTGHEYLNGTLPLWNPYQGYGQPLAANMQSQPFFPLTALLSLHLTPFTYNLYLLTRLFIAGFFGYLYLRLFVSFVPALGGGIAVMLGGYYILYMTMPHLSVEMLIPAALLTSERLIRLRTYGNLLAFAVVLFLVTLGGMPESALLLFTLVYSYIAFRLISDAELHRAWLQAVIRVSIASVAGLALSAVLLLPFLEYLRHSQNTHDPRTLGAIPGLFHYWPDPSIFSYFFPLLLGPYHELANEFGIIAFFLILVSVITASGFCNNNIERQLHVRLRSLTFFFVPFLVLLVLKRFGIEPVNSIGRLPLFRFVDFYKYEEALVTVLVSILCGIGLQRLIKRDVPKGPMAVALGVAFSMIPLAAVRAQTTIAAELRANQIPAKFPEIALGIAGSALFGLAICLIVFERHSVRLAVSVVVLLTAELSLNYIPTVYYIDARLPDRTHDPYLGAPYVDFLKRRLSNYDRVFARDKVLYPDWASAFGLSDIRDLDAMYYWRYLPFVRNFVSAGSFARASELWDRFTGSDLEYGFRTPLERRLLQLSSVRYLLAIKPYVDVPFRRVYDNEITLYEYDDILPRAALYYQAEIEKSGADVLRRLAEPGFDIFQTALLETANLNGMTASSIARVNQGAMRAVEPARIVSYEPASVEIEASLAQDGILVVNDSVYPGWSATIDGTPTKLLTVNYLFRGVLLPPGKHVVKFIYRPRTFYLGGTLALSALVCLLWPAAGTLLARLRWRGDRVPSRVDIVGANGHIPE